MRKVAIHMQMTLDGRISNADGLFWEPFPYGDPETTFVNDAFRQADTWAMGRRFYEFVVPYWEQVAAGTAPPIAGVTNTPARREFAEIQGGLTKVVFSHTIGDDPDTKRVVISGDIAKQLAAMKAQPGKDIILSSGPGTLVELAREPGLIDEYLLVIHPAVITAGPRLFETFEQDLALDLLHAEVFEGGAIIARYRDRAAS